MLKIRRTTLGFGVVQILLGVSLTALSFVAFAFTSSNRIRNACPYWAGFTVFCSGGVGIIAWKRSSVMSMSLFTFFSAVCVVLQMIGTILTGDAGGLLKSLVMCEKDISGQTCKCCDSIMACRQNVGVIEFEDVDDCSIVTGLLTGLMYGLCVLTIFGSLLCFIATILGCTAVARETSRNQGLCGRHSSRRSHPRNQECYTWAPYPTDLTILPPYAPPVYHSVENFQDYGISSCIVPPPVFDPTDLPPPYSSQNPSLAESQYSLSSPESSNNQAHFAACQNTEVHFQAESHDQDLALQAPQCTTCSTPSGFIYLESDSPSWDTHSNSAVDSIDLLSGCGSSDLSSSSSDRVSSDREHIQTDITDSHDHSMAISRATPFKEHRPMCSTSRIQAELSELVKISTGARKRTSSLGLIQETSTRDMVNTSPVRTTSGSHTRGTTILSLRTRSRSLGESSIYVNSFEVIRPPPNMRVPADEPRKPSSTDNYFNTRNARHRLRRGTTHKGDTLIALHGGRHGEQRRERNKHRRRRHVHNIPKHKGKQYRNCELVDYPENCGPEASGTQGKETIV